MKKIQILCLASAMTASLLAACAPTVTSSSSLESSSSETSVSSQESSVSPKERQIIVKDFGSVSQGSTLNLEDYVSVQAGTDESDPDLSWHYEILTSSAKLANAESSDDEGPSLYPAKKIIALRPGRCVIRISSGSVSKLAYFDIAASSELTDTVGYFASHSLTNFTLKKAFSVDTAYTVAASDPTPVFYKAENYVYYPSEYYGLAINKTDSIGYYYQLNAPDNDASFRANLNGASNAVPTLASFEKEYPDVSAAFTRDNMMYLPAVASLFGEKYAYVLPYDTSIASAYLGALSSLGLSTSHKVNGTTFYTIALVPQIADGALSFYALSSNSKSGAILEGPYQVASVGTTSLKSVDSFVEGAAPSVLASPDALLARFSGISSYTVSGEGHYEDLSGNKIDAPTYFASSLPEMSVSQRVSESAYESTKFNLIDDSSDAHAMLMDDTLDGTATTLKYVLNDEGKYTSVAAYGKDPITSIAMDHWENSRTFMYCVPVNVFDTITFEYPAYQDDGSGTYDLTGFNDSLARVAIRKLLGASSSYAYVQNSSPFSYYSAYSTCHVNFGTVVGDDITGEIYCKLIDGSGNYYVYHYTFAFTKVNATTIEKPTKA